MFDTNFSDAFDIRRKILNPILTPTVTKESLQDFNDCLASGDVFGAIKILGLTFYQNSSASPTKFKAALQEGDITTAVIILAGDVYHDNLNRKVNDLNVNETFQRHFGMIRRRTQ